MRVDKGQCGDQLRRVLNEYAECLTRLRDILAEERTALERQDADNLRSVTISKELCVKCIGELESERMQLCRTAGFDADESGMRKICAWCEDGGEAEAIWRELIQCARESETANRVNGAIGRVRYQQVSHALAIVNGSAESEPIYTAKGQEAARYLRRDLARI